MISGAEEAALAFDGAVRHLRTTPADPVLVVDIGGGSTELVLGSAGSPDAAHSMDVGSVRLHERHLHSDPPTAEEVAACVADIDAHLDASPVDVGRAARWSGWPARCSRWWQQRSTSRRTTATRSTRRWCAVTRVREVVDRLVGLRVDQRLALGYMHPGRADVIDAGALILSRILARTHVEALVASEADILDGIAWSMV